MARAVHGGNLLYPLVAFLVGYVYHSAESRLISNGGDWRVKVLSYLLPYHHGASFSCKAHHRLGLCVSGMRVFPILACYPPIRVYRRMLAPQAGRKRAAIVMVIGGERGSPSERATMGGAPCPLPSQQLPSV